MSVAGRGIVLGVGGGIAAYKVVELARRLTQAGAGVQVVMTAAAREFVGALTFSTLTGRPVIGDLFTDPPPGEIAHTTLGRSADLVVVAPATADIMARAATGLAGDQLGALLLATRAPVIMAPAMHTGMWQHPATVANVATLRSRGVSFVGPVAGDLAGPDAGVGRLAEVSDILAAVQSCLAGSGDLRGHRVLVSAGGTQEPIDPVRFIGNRSSGRMGYALAAEALRRGAEVTLVSGPSHLAPPPGAHLIAVQTAAEMLEVVLAAAPQAGVVIMAAAVSDWRPAETSPSKLKKGGTPPEIVLEPTGDILAALSRARADAAAGTAGLPGAAASVSLQVLVGFAAETADPEAGARAKLAAKGVDLVVGNLVGAGDSGFDVDTNRAVLVDRFGRVDRLALLTKAELARLILDAVVTRFPAPRSASLNPGV